MKQKIYNLFILFYKHLKNKHILEVKVLPQFKIFKNLRLNSK